MTDRIHFLFYIAFALFLTLNKNTLSQDADKSLALKKNRPQKKHVLFYQPDLSYQIQRRFNLIKDANSGNPLAEHELGLRYLLGEDGLPADTFQGAYWIAKAAKKNLTAACYNYGILLLNGWGVEWNPFEAFDFFFKAANDGMPQAQYLLGILYTDNLIVKRNYNEAFNWLSKSARSDYIPAKEILKELEKYIHGNYSNSNKESKSVDDLNQNSNSKNSLSSQLGLVFIDFEALKDTVRDINDKHLIQDLFNESNLKLADTLGLTNVDSSLSKINFNRISVLEKFADSGNPEALTILGRLNQIGLFFEKDLINAAEYYILASQLNYPKAKILLLKIIDQDFIQQIHSEIKNNHSPSAMFVFYGLWSLGLYSSFLNEEANEYLVKASKLNHIPSIIELGNNYITKKSSVENSIIGIDLWKSAETKGSLQAKIRIAAVNILKESIIEPIETSIKTLNEAAEMGSVLAQITLAFCYENGIGLPKSKSEAAKLYRLAAQRGNNSGYIELKRLYDEIRPNEKRFSTTNY